MRRLFVLFMLFSFLNDRLHAQDVPSEPIVYQVPEMAAVQVKQNIVFKKINDTSLTLDVYYPPSFDPKTRLPVVIFNNGVGSMTIPLWRVYKD